MGGLNIDDFLKHGQDSKRKSKYLKNWKKEGKIQVWLSTRAAIYPAYVHVFNEYGTWKDRDTGEEKETLRFTRFISPDADLINAEQYFRDDDSGLLRSPPVKDPFLILREWLRTQPNISADQAVFKWTNPKTGEDIVWRKGVIAREIEKKQKEWGHSLDSKMEYKFVVVDDDNPGEGPQIVTVTKLLGEKMQEAIKQEIQSNGIDDGDPWKKPYAFRWVFDKGVAPMKMYRAFRYNKAELTDAIREGIMSEDFGDVSKQTEPQPGDKARIRAAMEAAAQIELPWDLLFSDAWDDNETPPVYKKPEAKIPATPPAKKVDTSFEFGANVEQPKEETKETGPKRRRKKKEEPKPPPVETIPCDECDEPMLPTDTVCKGCGAEYEDLEQPVLPKPAAAKAAAPVQEEITKCWSCGSAEIENDTCQNCGLDIADDIPIG